MGIRSNTPIACDANDPRLGMGAETPRPKSLNSFGNMDEGIAMR